MTISTTELRNIFDRLVTKLEAEGHQTIELTQDYYWDIQAPARYKMYETPGNPSIGQLSDEWSSLQRVLNGESEPLNYNLIWLAAILRAIGEQITE